MSLQFAAPLVHAHVHDLGTARGVHLHEFESLQLKADTPFMAASDIAPIHSAIVQLGAAINVPQDHAQLPLLVVSSFNELQLPKRYIVETINFSPHETGTITDPFLNQHATRAPPRSI